MRDRRVIQIEDRIAEVTSLPAAHGEYFWVQQIEPGDRYDSVTTRIRSMSGRH